MESEIWECSHSSFGTGYIGPSFDYIGTTREHKITKIPRFSIHRGLVPSSRVWGACIKILEEGSRSNHEDYGRIQRENLEMEHIKFQEHFLEKEEMHVQVTRVINNSTCITPQIPV